MGQNGISLALIRYIVVAIIWIGVLLFGIAVMDNISSTSSTGDNSAVAMGIAAFICAAVATGFLLNPDDGSSAKQARQAAQDPAKRKNDQRAVSPLGLLTDEDIAELRAEMKDVLRRRMLEDDQQVTSFEALLSEHEQRKRR